MAKGRSYNQIFQQYLTFGFDPQLIKMAYDNVKGEEAKLLDQIMKIQQNNNSFAQNTQQPSSNMMTEEEMIGKVIQQSLDDAKAKNISFEPLNPQQRLRKTGIPVGLKNVGNTCYFNSLLQAYFYNPKFIRQVLSFQQPSFIKKLKDDQKSKDPEIKRKVASITLVKNLQYLFAGMIASDKKYLDPTSVITSIVDDYGNDIPIGDQKDIGQFNLYFLSRVEEGISLQDKYQSQQKLELEDKQELDLNRSASKIGVLGEHASQDSILKRSSIRVALQSTIGQEFFGKMETTFLNEKEGIKKSQQEMFTLLFVNVHHKQLYTAFEEAIFSLIEDYRNDKGEIVTVQKQTWIKQPPKTLFFQIQRVLYDKQTKNLKKIHDLFDFPKQFYIDPFLLVNKQKSLVIRKEVTKLRQTKVRLLQNLKKLQNYNDSNLSISKIIEQTIGFLQLQSQQAMLGEGEQFSNPLIFDQIKTNFSKQNLNNLRSLKHASEAKINYLKQQIQKLEVQIEKAYKPIRTRNPYKLQSILIHEGVADSGHYYSYSYDAQNKTWRKYNDINVIEEQEEQVMKLARGSGVTSAYYLVYTQSQNLQNATSSDLPIRNYSISSDANYGADLYSHYLSKENFNQILADNNQLYHDIETHKAAGFLNKVIDTYTKRFESCNELSRKLKVSDQDKKKNMPPVLVNLPIYIKNVVQNEQDYKASIIYSTSKELGPKQQSPVFDELLKNKLTNLSEFKRPKKTLLNETHEKNFTRGVLASTLITNVYKLIQNGQWDKAAIALTLVRLRFSKEGQSSNASNSDYFTWISTVFSRVYILKILIQIQKCTENKDFQKGLYLTRIFAGFFSFAIPILEEKSIIANLIFWLLEISIQFPEENRPQMEQMTNNIKNKIKMVNYQAIIEKGFEEFQIILSSIDINNQKFNYSRQQDTIIKDMTKAQQAVSSIMKSSNDLLKEMKKSQVPFASDQRNKFIK